MNKPPIIRIEVESMKQAMLHAFSQQLLDMDKQFKAAIDHACHPDRVQKILNDAAEQYIKEAIQEETKSYFLYGDGRNLIAAKVKEKLGCL